MSSQASASPPLTQSATARVFAFAPGRVEGDPHRKDLLGGKGASLAAMCLAGLPTPPGFTISAECCREYLAAGRRWPDGLEAEVRRQLAQLEATTGRRFGDESRPLLVSVRSGAAVSMPGMMDTLLNVGLPAEAPPWETLAAAISAVFDSWNSPRAVVYRKAHDIQGLPGTAVTVQAMFPSEASGVAFTANPATAADEIVIESARGLGEAVVSGAVTPDRFVLDPRTLELKDQTLGHSSGATGSASAPVCATGSASADSASANGQPTSEPLPPAPSIGPADIRRVAELALQAQAHFGTPVDIEWGLAGGELVLLQSRPIRGLDIVRDGEAGRQAEIARLRTLAGDKRRVWVVHNLSETLPAPTPLTWDIVRQFMSGDGGFGRMYRDFGYRPSARVLNEGFLELILGRIYVDPDRAAELFWGNMPLEYDVEALVKNPALVEAAPTKFEATRADGAFFLRLPGLVAAMLRSSRRMKRARREAVRRFHDQALPPYQKYLAEQARVDLTQQSTPQLLELLAARIERVLGQFGGESLKPGFFAGLARAELEAWLVQLAGPEVAGELCLTLTAGLENDSTVEQNLLFDRVERRRATLAEFLREYGHRVVGEMELSEPRWSEDAAYLERLLATASPGKQSPAALHEARVAKRLAVQVPLPIKLAEWGGSAFEQDILDLVRETQALLPYRELGKHYLMHGYATIRAVIVELGRRWDLGRDVFFLRYDELPRFERDRAALAAEIAARKIRWRSAKRLDHPQLVDSEQLDRLGLPRELPHATQWSAVALSPGVVEGTAIVVEQPSDAVDLPTDAVLVCPSTDPGWTTLFLHVKGLIVERGGVLSHGAITARDFGLPAAALPDATRLVPSGTRVRIDGDRGQITLLE